MAAAAVALAATAAMAPPPVLRLAGFFPMRGAWPGGVSVRPAVMAAIADVNNDTTLLNQTELQLVAHDSACDGPTALTEGLAYHPTMNSSSYEAPIVGILGPGCSPACESMSILANVWRYPTLSFSCTSPTLSNTADYPYFLRLPRLATCIRSPLPPHTPSLSTRHVALFHSTTSFSFLFVFFLLDARAHILFGRGRADARRLCHLDLEDREGEHKDAPCTPHETEGGRDDKKELDLAA